MSDTEQRTRELAYRLWEEAGCPDGRDDDFWHAANDLISTQEAEAAAEAAAPAPAEPPPAPKAAETRTASPAPAAPKARPVAAQAAAVAVDKPTSGTRRPAPKKS